MDSTLPPFHRWATRLTMAAAWMSVALVGITSRTDPPATISAVQPEWISWSWAILAILGGLVAMWGAIRADYWAEAIAAWFAAAGISGYVLTVWLMVWSGEYTRATQAWSLTALVIFMMGRASALGNHAYKVRREQLKLMRE